jgi:preprotein translocase SecE subunit
MKQFLIDARKELSLVTWLTKKQAIRVSAITTAFVVGSALFLMIADFTFTSLLFK